MTSTNDIEKIKKDYWVIRRRLTIFTLLAAYSVILYLIVNGSDESVLHENIASSINLLIAATIAGYIGVAVYDDINTDEENSNAMEADSKFWFVRRLLVISNVLFTFSVITYMLVFSDIDSTLYATIATDNILTTIAVILAYIGGSTVQDRYNRKYN